MVLVIARGRWPESRTDRKETESEESGDGGGFCDRVLLGELDVECAAAVINIATLRPTIQYHADRCQRCVEDSNNTDRCRKYIGNFYTQPAYSPHRQVTPITIPSLTHQ